MMYLRTWRLVGRALGAACLLALAACGDDDGHALSGGGGTTGFAGSQTNGGGVGGVTGATAGANTGDSSEPPPEVEVELSFERPAVGRRRIYTLNPATDRVAVVDAQTFAVESIEVGDEPDFAATVPGQDVAAVLNVGSRSVSILRTEEGRTSSVELPLDIQANRLVMAPGGGHVVAYFDARLGRDLADSFQDVAVVSLASGEETSSRITVGFRPSRVQFSEDGARAFVTTEDGISVIDLADASEDEEGIARLVGVGDTVTDPVSTDVSITSDGGHALVRAEGGSELRLVDLETGDIATLDVATLFESSPDPDVDGGTDAGTDGGVDAGGDVDAALDGGAEAEAGEPSPPDVTLTDADLAADGSFALAVVRSESTLLQLPIPEAFEDASTIRKIVLEDVPLIGSAELSNDGELAVAYTTADLEVESVTLVELGEPFAQHSVRLRKAVRAVAFAQDASRLLVLHAAKPASTSSGAVSEDERIDQAQGYSVVDVPNRFAKLQLTDALVSSDGGFVITPDASHLFVMLRNDDASIRELQQVDLSNLSVRSVPLSAPPTTLGVVPEVERAFVGQELAGGMLTFLHWPDGSVRTVTGFELSSRIRQ